eukprot:m.31018 g.31018  ORF g.31018 m.31018 type:complete len:598 (+) comp10661_c0_seq1:91-1884(+)
MSTKRPVTGMRVGTSYGRVGTARVKTGVRTGTAMRTGTARMNTGRLGTAAMGAGLGGSLNTQVTVGQRPMTQQGLGGARPKTQGPGRMVMDESYFLGALRSKSSELTEEINKLQKELEKHQRDHASYVTYEKKAEALAKEIQELTGQLADLNALANNLNDNVDIDDVRADMEEIKARNDREAAEIDNIFADRNRVEQQIKEIEGEIDAEKRRTENIVQEMPAHQRQAYDALSQESENLQQDIEKQQQNLDRLTETNDRMQKELEANPVKREAASLLDQIAALRSKHDKLREQIEKEALLSPEKLKEKLLDQVKADNQEISGMERRIAEVQQRINEVSSDVADLDAEEDEEDDEKRQKYLQLVKHEQEMDTFLLSFDADYEKESRNLGDLQKSVESLLAKISHFLESQRALPSQNEAMSLKDDLEFKSGELQKSQSTAKALEAKRQSLAADLQNVEHLEEKIERETTQLQEKLRHMQEELEVYADIQGLTKRTEQAKRDLLVEKQRLSLRRETMKKMMSEMANRYEKLRSKLKSNETHIQLSNLEKKWQHYEKNNFVVREFVLAKAKESDYSKIASNVQMMIKDYNLQMQQVLAGRPL